MMRIIKYFCFLLILDFAAAVVPIEKAAAQGATVSFQLFYDRLSPYGQWVDFPEEGYVWIPSNEPGFSPYSTGGYWVFTDYGWTWVCDYPWGWAPFHYGRWDFDDDYGWYWVPGYEWSPAWVAWSSAPGYYGWAPLRPGIEVDAAITGGYYLPPERWHYVHEEYLGRRDMDRHYAPQSENLTHIRNATMINHTYIDKARNVTYIGGPARDDVAKSTGAPVKQYSIINRSTPGVSVSKNQVRIYQPNVVKTTAVDPKPAPRKLTNITDVKPIPGRTANPEKLSIAPPAQSAPPAARQPNRVATPQHTAQPAPQHAAAENNSPPPARQTTHIAAPQLRQQPMPQKLPPQRDLPNRYAAPQYQAPKSNTPMQHAAPNGRIGNPHQSSPRNIAPPQQHSVPSAPRMSAPHASPQGKNPHR